MHLTRADAKDHFCSVLYLPVEILALENGFKRREIFMKIVWKSRLRSLGYTNIDWMLIREEAAESDGNWPIREAATNPFNEGMVGTKHRRSYYKIIEQRVRHGQHKNEDHK